MTNFKKVPPDGGYGWVIAAAYALHHLIIIPILQGFGLVYKDKFEELNFTATETGLILNTCGAFSMLCGIVAGPLIKNFGFRKVSLFGAFCLTSGIFLTAYADTFSEFIIYYGFLTAFGMGLGLSSYPVALNSYFTKNRSKATGYTMTIAGLGPIFMPQLLSFLLSLYNVTGAMIILAGISAHTFVSSCLLQPVQKHLKKVIEKSINNDTKKYKNEMNEDDFKSDHEDSNKNQLEVLEESIFDVGTPRRKISRQISKEIDVEAMFSLDSTFSQSLMSLAESYQRQTSLSLSEKTEIPEIKIKLFDENGKMIEEIEPLKEQDEKLVRKVKNESILWKIRRTIIDTFDLSLLKDPIYLNITIGMSLAIFAEINFSMLTPFIIGDYNLTTQQIATFMSVISCTDICFRFLAPYIGACLSQSHRIQYLLSLFLLVLSRFALLATKNYYPLLIVAAGLGIARGFRTVYSTLVIPSYVPIERLASAMGMQMAMNGIFIWIGGPLIGFIRDITGSYVKCIYVINAMTFTAFIMWSIELLYMRYKKK